MNDSLTPLVLKLLHIFEIKAGFRDVNTQIRVCEKYFQLFDTDKSGFLDFNEFRRAMTQLNFIGIQTEIEQLFDYFDEDLSESISYAEFARAIVGKTAVICVDKRKTVLLQQVQQKLLEVGGKNGVHTLRVILRRMDQNRNGVLEFDEFQEGMKIIGFDSTYTREDFLKVFQYFDRDHSGQITINELIRGLRGSMPKHRILLVRQAFNCLDISGDGRVTLDEVERLYDPSHHPEVLAGRMHPHQALLEFMRVFEDSETCDGEISWHEFLNYYKDISAGIENDNEFELMIRNAWHLSGGHGETQNTTCRRVLVTFHDGRQGVFEIENDLGITKTDTKALLRKLKDQGLEDISRISLSD